MRSLQIRIEDLQRTLVKFTITALSKQPPHQMFAVVVLLRRWSAHHRLFEVHITVKNKVDRRLVCNINVKTVQLMFLAPWHAREFPVVALLPQCGTNRGRYSLFRRLLTLL